MLSRRSLANVCGVILNGMLGDKSLSWYVEVGPWYAPDIDMGLDGS